MPVARWIRSVTAATAARATSGSSSLVSGSTMRVQVRAIGLGPAAGGRVLGLVGDRQDDVLAEPQRGEPGRLRRPTELDELGAGDVVDGQPDVHRQLLAHER